MPYCVDCGKKLHTNALKAGNNMCWYCRNNLFCIICGKKITLASKSSKCRSCCQKGKVAWNKNIPMREETKVLLKNTFWKKGRKVPKEIIEKREATCKVKYKGGQKSKDPVESNRKRRLSTIRYIKSCKGKCVPRYNKKAICVIEAYGKQHGYNFQHAENGGEFYISKLGYWVDGYDKENNVVIEYYESHHKSLIDRDENRKKDIINLLNCKFIEIKQWQL